MLQRRGGELYLYTFISTHQISKAGGVSATIVRIERRGQPTYLFEGGFEQCEVDADGQVSGLEEALDIITDE